VYAPIKDAVHATILRKAVSKTIIENKGELTKTAIKKATKRFRDMRTQQFPGILAAAHSHGGHL
jgi:hypothetical protein